MVTFFNSKNTGDAFRPLLGMDPEQTGRYGHFRSLLDHNRKDSSATKWTFDDIEVGRLPKGWKAESKNKNL